MELIDLKLSIRTIDILQKAGMWRVDDIPIKMMITPTSASVALARIHIEDFIIIMEEIKNRSKNDLDKSPERDTL